MRRLPLLCLSLCLAWAHTVTGAEQWRVAVAEMPGLAEANGSGPLPDLLRALDAQLPDIDFELQITPFARTFHLLQNGQCEFQVPFLGNLPRLPAGLRYGSGRLWQVRFGLFTQRGSDLSVAQLLDPAHVLSAERLAASGMDAARPEWLDQWARWPGLAAGAAGNLFFIPPELIQRHTPRILDGAERLCEQLETARQRRAKAE